MKKTIYVLIVMIAAMLSVQSFSIINERNFYYISGIPDHIAQIESAESLYYYLEFPEDIESGSNALIRYCDKHNYSMVIHCASYNLGTTYAQYYLYTKNNDVLSDNKIIKDYDIDFSKIDEEHIYATYTDKYDGQLVCLDKNYFDHYMYQYSVHNMCKIAEAIENNNRKVALQIYAQNRSQLETELEKLFSEYNVIYTNATDGLAPVQIEYLDNEGNNKMTIVLCLTCVLLVLLYLLNILQRKRKIMIYRLHGQPALNIVCNEFMKQSMLSILIFAFSILLFAYVQTGNPSAYNLDYYQCSLLYIGYFIFFIILSLIVSYIYVQLFVSVKYLKMEFKMKHIAELNLVLKLVVMCLLISPLTGMIQNTKEQLNTYIMLKKYSDITENIASVYVDGKTEDRINLFEYLNEHNGYYADFLKYYSSTETFLRGENPNISDKELKDCVIEYPFILANANYLDEHNIKDISGNVLDLHKLNEDVILVPEKNKNVDYTKIMFGNQIDVIYIKDTDSYINLMLEEPYVLKNPVIRVITHHSDLVDDTRMCIDLRENTMNDYDIEFKNVVDSKVDYQKKSDIAYSLLRYLKGDLKNLIIMIIMYILFIFVLVYQTTYLYMNENQKRLAIEYMNGISFVNRYKELLIYTSITYIVIVLIGSILLKLNCNSFIIFTLISMLIEIIIEYLFIYRFERKNISVILKGEVL